MHDPLHFEVILAVLLVESNIVKVRVYIFLMTYYYLILKKINLK